MSRSPSDPESSVAFAPSARLTVGLVAAEVLAAVLIPVVDWPGRLLRILATLLIAGEALRAVAVRPVLAADAAGLTLRTLFGSHHYPWARVVSVEPKRSRRLIAFDTVEIDFDDGLIVLAAYRLGTGADDVAGALEGIRNGFTE